MKTLISYFLGSMIHFRGSESQSLSYGGKQCAYDALATINIFHFPAKVDYQRVLNITHLTARNYYRGLKSCRRVQAVSISKSHPNPAQAIPTPCTYILTCSIGALRSTNFGAIYSSQTQLLREYLCIPAVQSAAFTP